MVRFFLLSFTMLVTMSCSSIPQSMQKGNPMESTAYGSPEWHKQRLMMLDQELSNSEISSEEYQQYKNQIDRLHTNWMNTHQL